MWCLSFALALAFASSTVNPASDAPDPGPRRLREVKYTAAELVEAKQQFDEVDQNKDGFLSRPEIDEDMKVTGGVTPEAQINLFFKTYDANADDLVSWDEITAVDSSLPEKEEL